jgi:hypothetical protein
MLSAPLDQDALWTTVVRDTDPSLFPDIPPLTHGFVASFSAYSQPGDFTGPLSLQITLTLTNLPAGRGLPSKPADPPEPTGVEIPPLVLAH